MVAVVRPGTGPVILAVPDAPLPAVRGADLGVSAGGCDLRLVLEDPLARMRVTARGAAAAYGAPAGALRRSPAYDLVLPAYERRLQTWRDWETVTRSADA